MKTEVPNEYNNDLVERMYDNQLVIKSILLKEIGKVKIQVAQSGDKKLKEKQALVNFDRFRLDVLNAQTDDMAFHKRYQELQVMANLGDYTEFLKEMYFL